MPSLYNSTSFNMIPILQELHTSGINATRRLTSDIVVISEWCKEAYCPLMPQNLKFLYLRVRTRQPLPDTYPQFFDNASCLLFQNKHPWPVLNSQAKLEICYQINFFGIMFLVSTLTISHPPVLRY